MDVLICLKANGSPYIYVVPGSIKVPCEDCGELVHMAPSSQGIKDQLVVVCVVCGQARLGKEEDPELIMTEGQAEEIKAWSRRQ